MKCLLCLLAILAHATPATAQAPQSSAMWRVATASLAVPPASQAGPTGAFWNPATVGWGPGGTFRAGVQVLHTPDAVGLKGILGGLDYAIGRSGMLGVTVGRVEVRDLVRTFDSPLTQLGAIPVYEQLIGVHGSVRLGAWRFGGTLRAHESRFDAERSTGATLDFGLRLDPFPGLTVSAATHFLPVTFDPDGTTDYYAGVVYRVTTVPLWGHQTDLLGRYGASYRNPGGFESTVGAGIVMDGWLLIDGTMTHERAFGGGEWRPAFQVGLVLGRYVVTAARGNGINGLGATYRFALEVDLAR